jgi:predicted DCC family thiol-disulfide oxidoreductase YuxK
LRWVEGHCRPVPAARPFQDCSDAELAAWGLTRHQVERSVWWVHGDARWSGSVAVGHLLLRAGALWSVFGLLLLVPPFRWVGRGVYRVVAWSRPHLPGRWFDPSR